LKDISAYFDDIPFDIQNLFGAHGYEVIYKGKGKVVLFLFLTEHHAMKAYWGNGGCIQKFPDWPPGARTANGTDLCH
jgi:hypothetical protein